MGGWKCGLLWGYYEALSDGRSPPGRQAANKSRKQIRTQNRRLLATALSNQACLGTASQTAGIPESHECSFADRELETWTVKRRDWRPGNLKVGFEVKGQLATMTVMIHDSDVRLGPRQSVSGRPWRPQHVLGDQPYWLGPARVVVWWMACIQHRDHQSHNPGCRRNRSPSFTV